MREILFRGKTNNDTYTKDGEWIYSSFIMQDPKEELLSHKVELFNGKRWVAVDPETIGQYTGLTDKNGTKIFEGDIVRYINKVGIIKEVCGTLVCYWHKNYVSNNGVYEYLPYFVHNDLKLEVIGNIHDDPALQVLDKSKQRCIM